MRQTRLRRSSWMLRCQQRWSPLRRKQWLKQRRQQKQLQQPLQPLASALVKPVNRHRRDWCSTSQVSNGGGVSFEQAEARLDATKGREQSTFTSRALLLLPLMVVVCARLQGHHFVWPPKSGRRISVFPQPILASTCFLVQSSLRRPGELPVRESES